MNAFIFISLVIVVIVGIPIVIGVLLYYLPKRLGYPKTAKYLTLSFGIIILAIGLFTAFEDQLFTKNNAQELVEEQNFKLKDEFELLNNKSSSAIGDYYHTFTLKISDRDKQAAISKIKNSYNYKTDSLAIEPPLYLKVQDRYFGKKIIQNYETENTYVREYFEPSGRKGYAPTFRRISISKINNELTFEDIVEQ